MSRKEKLCENIARETIEELKRNNPDKKLSNEHWRQMYMVTKKLGMELPNENISKKDIDTIKEIAEGLFRMELREREILRKQEARKEKRRKNLTKAGIVLVIGGVAVASKLIGGQDEEQQENDTPKKPVIEQQNQNMAEEVEEKNVILEQLAEQFNEQNPKTPIEAKNLGIIEYCPEYLIKQANEDASITYIHNIKATGESLAQNQKFIYKSVGIENTEEETYQADKFYTVVNKKDGTIVITVANIDNYIVRVEVPFVQVRTDGKNQEFVANGQNFSPDLGGVSGADVYTSLRNKFIEIQEAQAKGNRNLVVKGNDGEER